MPSIIQGYEYDIFISYRQKDNKQDGWVTEFINSLNREIKATFKEDISIYFDENPYDGLGETHVKYSKIFLFPGFRRSRCVLERETESDH